MSLKDQPLRTRRNEFFSSEVPKHIQKFIEFFGTDAISKAQRDLDKTLLQHGQFYQEWMQQGHPWLFALRLYGEISGGHVRSWPIEIQRFAGDAVKILCLAKKMPEAVKEKYRKDLLTIQHADFIFEINTAWHYHLQGYDVEWYPLTHNKSTEYRVRGGGLDFDVECRRFTLDVGHRIKMQTMAHMSDLMNSVLQRCNYWGEVKVVFSDNSQFEPSRTRLWQQAFECAVKSGQAELQLSDGPLLKLKLESSPSPSYTRDQLSRMITDSGDAWMVSKEDGSSCFDPVIFRCQGVRKNPIKVRDAIYKRLRSKIKTQLSDSRAGVVYVRFTGIKNPHIFNKSDGMQEIIGKLFSHDRLAAIVFLCDGVSEPDNGGVVHSFPSILYRNPSTRHRDVADANHIGTSGKLS